MVKRIGQYDYHFMVQHNDGRWSHKPGQMQTNIIKESRQP